MSNITRRLERHSNPDFPNMLQENEHDELVVPTLWDAGACTVRIVQNGSEEQTEIDPENFDGNLMTGCPSIHLDQPPKYLTWAEAHALGRALILTAELAMHGRAA